VTPTEIRAAAATELPEGYTVGKVGKFDDRHAWAQVLLDGEPVARVDAPDNYPTLLVDITTGVVRWFDNASRRDVPSPLT
jgi:transglutaminase-like putative cysteine protease